MKVCKFEIDCVLLLLFLCEFYFILYMFCIFVCINFFYFLCQELWLFYAHFFSLSFFLVKYLILLMFCFIMYWPTDNSDILRLYNIYHIPTHYPDSEPTNVCSFSLMLHASRRSNKYWFYNLLFDPTRTQTHDLPHPRRER